MVELEREFTFLVDKLPADLDNFPSKVIEDIFIPISSVHPVVRIRKNGNKLVITKKYPVAEDDSSRMEEHTIELTPEEYATLSTVEGKKFKKRRFAYKVDGYDAELDVYLDDLAGLAVIDFEFDSDEAMDKFNKPEFVGADITQEKVLAGGMLCGKSYDDLADYLINTYNYKPLKDIEKYEEEK